MCISKETELIVRLLQLPGFGSRSSEIVANCMVKNKAFDEADIYTYIMNCINNKLIRVKKELSRLDIQYAVDKSNKIIGESLKNNVFIISKFDEDYPFMLRNLIGNRGEDTSPLILNYKGNLSSIKDRQSIAIIGTRHPTKEGEEAGMYYAKYFAEKGFNIVSGLALGCDTIAHKGALSVNGTTTAILAHGLQMISPKRNEFIAKEIILLSHGEIIEHGTPQHLLKKLNNRVYEVETSSEDEFKQENVMIVNIKMGANGKIYRIISESEPRGYNFSVVKAGLEELYMYYVSLQS